MNQLGIFAYFGYHLSLEYSLELIREAGFHQVLLWWGAFDGSPELMEQPELVRRKGLEVENAHFPDQSCNYLWLPGAAGEEYLQKLCRALRQCAQAGVPALVVHLTQQGPQPPCSLLGLHRLEQAAAAAEKAGVTLALENLQQTDHLYAAMNHLKSNRVGFCYDSGHHHCYATKQPLLMELGSRLAALHLHDNDGAQDQHRLPFEGSICWGQLAGQLQETNYRGGISLEVQAGPWEQKCDPGTFLAAAYKAAARIRELAQVGF